MEVKVFVDGVPRVVCGVTEETTCQQVVVSLAQALSQPGRYMLREKFKDFERWMTPGEGLLESLKKYGDQAREVRLTLQHNGPCASDQMSRSKVGRYQACPPLRRKDPGARTRRGSGTLSLHRQSLPPLPSSGPEAEQLKEQVKRPKRKSLTLMEEAWEWLENLGKGKVYSTTSEKEISAKTDRKNHSSSIVSLVFDGDSLRRGCRSKVKGPRPPSSDLDHQTSCCMGNPTRDGKHCKRGGEEGEDERNGLMETVVRQLAVLQDLQAQIGHVDQQIFKLEEKERSRRAERRLAQEELEQIQFWENELKAEEGHERDLQNQFLEMKARAAQCKSRLEEYKRQMSGLHVPAAENQVKELRGGEELELLPNQQRVDPEGEVSRKTLDSPHTMVPPRHNARERRPTGPTELREWWARWSEAQNTQSQSRKKVVHRSELIIYLASSKV